MGQNLAFEPLSLTQILVILYNTVLQSFSGIADIVNQILTCVASPQDLFEKNKQHKGIVERVNSDYSVFAAE